MARVLEPASDRAPLDVARIRKDFPILERVERSGKPLVYLDSAATSQKPRQVIDAMVDFYEHHNANVHRGVYDLASDATDLYEGARSKLAAFLNAPDPACIVFNRGTTESVNLLAHGWGRRHLREGDEVVLSEFEHHSNLIPWQLAAKATGARLRFVPYTPDEYLFDWEAFERLLGPRTKLVAVSGMSNVLGTVPPLQRIAEAAHAVGAVVFVDGAQLVPHASVDVQALGVDALTISGHKMLGPTASGGLYATHELLEDMDPFLGGGEMIMKVDWETATYNEVPYKFEAGTMNIAQEVGLGAAIDYLDGLGMENVHRHESDLAGYAVERLVDIGARVFGPSGAHERGGAVSFEYRDVHPHDLAELLNSDGIAVRAGHHCAQPLMSRLGVPATTRASFYVYNSRDEVDALVGSLERAGEFFS